MTQQTSISFGKLSSVFFASNYLIVLVFIVIRVGRCCHPLFVEHFGPLASFPFCSGLRIVQE